MSNRIYKVSDLKKIIKESTNEFKPVMGKNVENDNKKINDKAYNDIKKETDAYDGGTRKESKKINYPYSDNKGMQDLEYNNMSPEFKKKASAQMKGYVSADAEKKHKSDSYGNADFNEINGMKERHQDFQKGKNAAKEIGLTSHLLNKNDIEKQTDSVFEGKTLRVRFKNTVFITENHMLSKVPDDFKKEGNRFIMIDKANNEYLVEWHTEDEPKVINETKISNERNRIQELFAYKRGQSNTTNEIRLNEENKITDILNKARTLMK